MRKIIVVLIGIMLTGCIDSEMQWDAATEAKVKSNQGKSDSAPGHNKDEDVSDVTEEPAELTTMALVQESVAEAPADVPTDPAPETPIAPEPSATPSPEAPVEPPYNPYATSVRFTASNITQQVGELITDWVGTDNTALSQQTGVMFSHDLPDASLKFNRYQTFVVPSFVGKTVVLVLKPQANLFQQILTSGGYSLQLHGGGNTSADSLRYAYPNPDGPGKVTIPAASIPTGLFVLTARFELNRVLIRVNSVTVVDNAAVSGANGLPSVFGDDPTNSVSAGNGFKGYLLEMIYTDANPLEIECALSAEYGIGNVNCE